MPELKVLIIGGSGVFGSRLAELATREGGVALTLAGRTQAKLDAVADALDPRPETLVLERDLIDARHLAGFDLVIDTAGPFQSTRPAVISAALAARVPYVDIADGRKFVADFDSFDAVAKRRGVPLVTGASSIPALSHAVLDEMVRGWRAIDDIRIGIYPGNRAPRGKSVVEGILSYVGHPVRVFREGRWQDVPGWGRLHSETIPRLGRRWASTCDTPEQDLLVTRYRPRRSAEFYAGMELSLLHVGLWLLSFPVRWGWLKSLRPWTGPLLAIAKKLRPLGSDRGAMTVRARGEDAQGRPVEASWLLRADGNRGPYVPVLAALALIRRFRDGNPPAPGAGPCLGMLTLEDFAADFAMLRIETEMRQVQHAPRKALTPRGRQATLPA